MTSKRPLLATLMLTCAYLLLAPSEASAQNYCGPWCGNSPCSYPCTNPDTYNETTCAQSGYGYGCFDCDNWPQWHEYNREVIGITENWTGYEVHAIVRVDEVQNNCPAFPSTQSHCEDEHICWWCDCSAFAGGCWGYGYCPY